MQGPIHMCMFVFSHAIDGIDVCPHFLLSLRDTDVRTAEAKAKGADGAGVPEEETSVTREVRQDGVVDLLDGLIKILLGYLETGRNT